MAKTKIYDTDLLSTLRQNIVIPPSKKKDQGLTPQAAGSRDGLFNTIVEQPRRNFIVAGNNIVLSDSTRNCGIVIGADRPSGLASGYGGAGAMKANSIDLVAGRVSGQKALEDGVFVDNSFSGDAARIYISQLTDIDTNFGLEPGQSGNIKGRSGVGVKADVVRLIGREGIKIVTGRSYAFKGHGSSGETNSLGGKISSPAPPIELIAGNTKTEASWYGFGPEIRTLQGVAKGEHVRDALRELSECVDGIWTATFNMAFYNTLLFGSLGINIWHPHYPTMTSFTINKYLTEVLNPLWHTRANKSFWGVNYTNPAGPKYVVSRNVFAT